MATGDFVLLGATITWVRPLWFVVVGTAGACVALQLVMLLVRLIAPKIAAIARTTAKEALSQPLFGVLLALGIFALLLSPFMSYYTFGEDIKMLKAEGLTLIKILAVVLALWTASVSIADEIEGRTALTLLSKPVTRRQLIVGKFLGIIIPVAIVFIVLGALFLSTVSYKVVYDARETASPEPESAQCMAEMIQITPGLALAFLEAVTLASISVAISTRLPMMANMVICVSVYALGHLVTVLVETAQGQFAIVGFVADLLALVIPVLDFFSIETAISTGQEVPAIYLGSATLYAVLYCTVALFVALLLFEDRDLA